ncbi:MAG: ABC transporter permease [Desulfotalea sp.]
MIKNGIEKLGSYAINLAISLGRFVIFICLGFLNIIRSPFHFYRIIEQVWFIGVKSMSVIILTGFFTGMVLGLQGYYTLVKFGSEGMLGSAVALSIIRELGPVLTAIMVTARAGSAMAAEIGVMRISEQLDALKTMGINPIKFVFSPRLAAAIICLPLLTAIFDLVGILGGLITASMLGINQSIYLLRVKESVVMEDITGGFIKSLVFAIVVVGICCYKGYFTHLQDEGGFGAKAVSLATTNAVVSSCVLVLICDYLVTFILL